MSPQKPEVILYELGPSRSARARWILLEAGISYESRGNCVEILGSEELNRVHPLGKLPAAIINGQPLFESGAIVTAIADLVPEKELIAAPGTWARNLHYQWSYFAQTEMEPFAQSIETNTLDFILPKSRHVPAILEQNALFYQKGARVLDTFLSEHDFLVEDRFSATDIIVGYTILFGEELSLIDEFPALKAYLKRLRMREHCTLPLPPEEA